MVACAVANSDERAKSRTRSGGSAALEEAALSWSAGRVADLLPTPEPPEKIRLSLGYNASFDPSYRQWLRDFHQREGAAARALPVHGPVISVVVPVYRPKLWYFQACVESVTAQHYQDWELCICNDASDDPKLSAMLAELAKLEARVKVVERPENGGISRTTNDALDLASGQWVALLDHDDVLDLDALGEVAAAIEADTDTDIVYSDEDKMYGADALEIPRLASPHFKPDWAPDLLLTYPYLGHLLVIRRSLLQEIGQFRPEFDGSQDYDVMLRATERARRVTHVPKVLYHWRVVAGSAAGDPTAKPWAHLASRRVLEDALIRRRIDGVVDDGPGPGWYHVRRRIRGRPSVAVIIPFRDQAEMTTQCLSSLPVAPGYENFEVVLVDNGSTEPEVRALRRHWQGQGIHVIDYPGTFNWSAMNNLAVSSTDADLLLFMNNDIEATKPGWLHALVELAQDEDVGAVGAHLVYPDGVVQHAGVTLGLGGVAGHLFSGLPGGSAGYMSWAQVVRPCSAVTGACLMSRREVFHEVGAFDESLAVAFNDIDYCLRLGDAGYHVLYTPHADLVHHESSSRGISGFICDAQHLLRTWDRARFLNDPFYNPNLSLTNSWCGLRSVDEVAQWESQMDGLTDD